MQTMKRQEKHSHTIERNVTQQNAKRNQHEPRTNTQIMKNQVKPLTSIQTNEQNSEKTWNVMQPKKTKNE